MRTVVVNCDDDDRVIVVRSKSGLDISRGLSADVVLDISQEESVDDERHRVARELLLAHADVAQSHHYDIDALFVRVHRFNRKEQQ